LRRHEYSYQEDREYLKLSVCLGNTVLYFEKRYVQLSGEQRIPIEYLDAAFRKIEDNLRRDGCSSQVFRKYLKKR
jgi:hypothetical protein